MFRLVLVVLLFLLSLLNLFRAPLNLLWYVSILTTEFCWIFFLLVCVLLLFRFGNPKFDVIINITGLVSLVLYALPIVQAYRISSELNKNFENAFGSAKSSASAPFVLSKMITGIGAKKIPFQTLVYDKAHSLKLDFYPSQKGTRAPCIIVIHGGSWAGGTKEQLPELNSYLSAAGYNVATINYRLAPENIFPAPVEDVESVIKFLRLNQDSLHIDASRICLLGRSAGAQIALTAAYGLKDPAVKAAISYYGPTDMVWGYSFPANPLVLDSKKIMEEYLGGTYMQVPKQYEASSATEIIKDHAVPTLLIQGKNDPLVAYDHCNRLDVKLNLHQVKHFVLRMPWATHGCDYTLNGPAGQLCTYTTMRFLQTVLN